ncbi:HD domain-containing protein [Lutibacter sp.]|uniref:HD domain-containing protein n=1 Tax=Lutibacter sp. TaxID=1925666 RepID=UPI0025C61024|nr:HD domain-containing protein [Lutibacter sp.]MCF6181345.1 HD domain-containing protein [Lutibacter sp.]
MTRKKSNKLKILNDPIYGFIIIPSALIFDLIEHPYFQRLRRISQMGLSYLVYPGAHHTRFHHAIGCMHLMQKSVQLLRFKGVAISKDEETALYVAILLHDIGHGAFSHALEHSIVSGINHETISLKFMEVLNKEFNGKLSLAIEIFKGNHPKKYLYQLISSQLDMDRLDYLKRDSFYTGVAEGNINSERLITMLNVVDNQLIIEEKGIYSVEKFLISRRFMYWQVYLHKTGVVAEKLLEKVLKRAKELALQGVKLPASKSFSYFLYNQINADNFTDETLKIFAKLDNYDVFSSIKEWISNEDFILSKLSESLINRKLPKVILQNNPFTDMEIENAKNEAQKKLKLSDDVLDYFVFQGKISNQAYNTTDDAINILFKNGEVEDITKASDQLDIQSLSITKYKYFMCFPKNR